MAASEGFRLSTMRWFLNTENSRRRRYGPLILVVDCPRGCLACGFDGPQLAQASYIFFLQRSTNSVGLSLICYRYSMELAL